MVKVIWVSQALDDLNAICEFIERDSPSYARFFAEGVFEIVDQLERFPQSGRIVPEIDLKNIREIFFGNYRIIYRVSLKEVQILTLHHGARILKNKLV